MADDETMSQDEAFTTEGMRTESQNEPFKPFEGDKPEETKAKPTEASSTDNEVVEEQRVPYSRFKTLHDRNEQYESRIETLEEELKEMARSREAAAPTEVPKEWEELYGKTDLAKKAWEAQEKILARREAASREQTIKDTIALVRREQESEAREDARAEDTIDEYLSSLEDSLDGKRLTKKLEEDILTIVDEYSPTDANGKYTGLISPERALEIYELRTAKKVGATRQARQRVADLSEGSSQGEAETSEAPYQRGWDSWRQAL